MKNRFVSILGVVSLVLTSSISGQVLAADAAAGKAKYDMLCVSCHGATGVGDGVAAAALNPKPKNLQATTKSDEELAKVVKEGGAANGLSPLMPPWGHSLSDEDIANVVAHIRTLKK